MATYPSTLPVPLQSGYEFNPDDATLRTSMSAGAARVRRISTDPLSRVPVKWRFSAPELALFEAWHNLTLQDGALWFELALANGLGFATMTARFTKPPRKAALAGMGWEVSAELEVRNPPKLTQDYLDVATAYPPDELVYAAAIFDLIVNTTLPLKGY